MARTKTTDEIKEHFFFKLPIHATKGLSLREVQILKRLANNNKRSIQGQICYIIKSHIAQLLELEKGA